MAHAKLRGRIKEKFNTVTAFAEACQMSRYKVDSRLSGKTEWTIREIELVCEVLGLTEEDIIPYFFS